MVTRGPLRQAPPVSGLGGPWSWVATAAERQDRQQHANRLVGSRLQAVRYFDIDYEREDRAVDHEGPRRIEGNAEWRRPRSELLVAAS